MPTKQKNSNEGITKEMNFAEVLEKYPQTADIMMKHGLHCIGCHIAAYESIEQGCMAHGMGEEDLKKMIDEMNMAIKKK